MANRQQVRNSQHDGPNDARRAPSSARPRPGTGPDALLWLQRTSGNAAVSGLLAQVQRTTDFEPLAGKTYEVHGQWHGFMPQGGWHVSIFPVGQKGKRKFDEFHVTRQKDTGNKHHFYTDDGHVKLNDLNNVSFSNKEAWATANAMAAEFYQKMLGLHVTAEMLAQEVTTFQRRSGKVRTMAEHLAAEQARYEKAKKEELAKPLSQPVPHEEIDMFDFDEKKEQTSSAQPIPTPMEITAPAPSQGLYFGLLPPGPVQMPPAHVQAPPVVPQGPFPAPIVAPPNIGPLPNTTRELHRLYQDYVDTLQVDQAVRRRWLDALDQLYTRTIRDQISVANLKVLFDQLFSSAVTVHPY